MIAPSPAAVAAVAGVWVGAYFMTGALHALWWWWLGTNSIYRPIFDALSAVILRLPVWKQIRIFAWLSGVWLPITLKAGRSSGEPVGPLCGLCTFLVIAWAGTAAL